MLFKIVQDRVVVPPRPAPFKTTCLPSPLARVLSAVRRSIGEEEEGIDRIQNEYDFANPFVFSVYYIRSGKTSPTPRHITSKSQRQNFCGGNRISLPGEFRNDKFI